MSHEPLTVHSARTLTLINELTAWGSWPMANSFS